MAIKWMLRIAMSYGVFVSCAQAVHSNIKRIEFISTSRGYFSKQVFTSDSVEVIRADSSKVIRSIDKKEWNDLVDALNNVKLSEIPALKSPTMKRAYDGARHSSIYIITEDGNTWTHGFDDEDPHQQLQKLMTEISRIKNK